MDHGGKKRAIRAVVFDAVGTLIQPMPAAAEVYAAVGRQFGSALSAAEIRPRFAAAWSREEHLDRMADWKTSEERERQRWQRVVATVLDDVSDGEACFRRLYEHFSQPSAWRCDPDAAPVLTELMRRGYQGGVASNNDGRLRQVVAGLPELAGLPLIVISSEVGWRKPAAEFFTETCRRAGCAPEQMLYVGDDPVNDREGAARAGLKSVLFAPNVATDLTGMTGISRLTELLEIPGLLA